MDMAKVCVRLKGGGGRKVIEIRVAVRIPSPRIFEADSEAGVFGSGFGVDAVCQLQGVKFDEESVSFRGLMGA